MSEKFNIDNIAKLSRLQLTPSESERLSGHLETIIEYIDKLDELDTTDVEPTSHVIPLQNVFARIKMYSLLLAKISWSKVLPIKRAITKFRKLSDANSDTCSSQGRSQK